MYRKIVTLFMTKGNERQSRGIERAMGDRENLTNISVMETVRSFRSAEARVSNGRDAMNINDLRLAR
jgi:hypothetical protein